MAESASNPPVAAASSSRLSTIREIRLHNEYMNTTSGHMKVLEMALAGATFICAICLPQSFDEAVISAIVSFLGVTCTFSHVVVRSMHLPEGLRQFQCKCFKFNCRYSLDTAPTPLHEMIFCIVWACLFFAVTGCFASMIGYVHHYYIGLTLFAKDLTTGASFGTFFSALAFTFYAFDAFLNFRKKMITLPTAISDNGENGGE